LTESLQPQDARKKKANKKHNTKQQKDVPKAKEAEMDPEFSFEVEGDPTVMWIPKEQLADDISVILK
jgi:hypothetical protein